MIATTLRILSFQRVRPALGTLVAIEAEFPAENHALGAIDAAFAAVERVGVLMHPTAGGGDLLRVMCAEAGVWTPVDPWTFSVLVCARDLHEVTGGAFDPCTPEKPGRMQDLDLSVSNHVARRAPVAIDLGGIAKGFAVDRAVDILCAHGCEAALVNAGGDLRVFGENPRLLAVRLPSGAVAQIELANAALAVSGPKSGASPSQHRGHYMGSTGEAVAGELVAITAREAMIADALTKCAMLCSESTVASVLNRYGARLLDFANPRSG